MFQKQQEWNEKEKGKKRSDQECREEACYASIGRGDVKAAAVVSVGQNQRRKERHLLQQMTSSPLKRLSGASRPLQRSKSVSSSVSKDMQLLQMLSREKLHQQFRNQQRIVPQVEAVKGQGFHEQQLEEPIENNHGDMVDVQTSQDAPEPSRELPVSGKSFSAADYARRRPNLALSQSVRREGENTCQKVSGRKHSSPKADQQMQSQHGAMPGRLEAAFVKAPPTDVVIEQTRQVLQKGPRNGFPQRLPGLLAPRSPLHSSLHSFTDTTSGAQEPGQKLPSPKYEQQRPENHGTAPLGTPTTLGVVGTRSKWRDFLKDDTRISMVNFLGDPNSLQQRSNRGRPSPPTTIKTTVASKQKGARLPQREESPLQIACDTKQKTRVAHIAVQDMPLLLLQRTQKLNETVAGVLARRAAAKRLLPQEPEHQS